MKTVAKWNPLRTRNVLFVALGLGIVAGVWLGDLFKGFGWGPGQGPGLGPGTGRSAGDIDGSDADDAADLVGVKRSKSDPESSPDRASPGGLIKVLIDDRSYFLLRGDSRGEIELGELVDLIRQTKPNEDGLRAVIDRTAESRVTTEDRLFDALKAAGVPSNAVYLTPTAVE